MKLNIGLSAAFAGIAAASQQPAADGTKVYILRGSHHIEPTTSITPSEARLILYQRLAPEGQDFSFRDLTDSDDERRVISLMNKYGKAPAPLLSDEKTATPRQLAITIDGMPTFEYESFFGWLFNTQPDFTTDISKENGEHPEVFANVLAKMPQCPLSQIVALDEKCFNGQSAYASYSRSQDGDHPTTLLNELPKLQKLAESGELQTILVFLPLNVDSEDKSDKDQELRRRQAETVISSIEETAESPAETSTTPAKPSNPIKAVCFTSEDSCMEATGNCTGHGKCLNKYGQSKDACFACHCQVTKSESGSVTHWGGNMCQKQDISVQFWLFAGFTLALLTILYMAIGMLFSVGEEKLPGVIGAGVSRSKTGFFCFLSKVRRTCHHTPPSIPLLQALYARQITVMISNTDRPKPATAKWGAACAQCSTAKAKCIRSNNTPGSKCDRCERLVKNCTEQVHRPRKKRTVKPSGVAPPPPASDEELLKLYRKELQALHPFVIIPDGVTAAKLKATRPFLMSSIRMVTSYRSLRSMRAQMYHLMKYIADHMLIRSERSLDLLLGIIVIIAWYKYHCFMHAQLNNLIALASTLVGELGLHRSPTVLERTSLMVVTPFQPAARTNEERRALLGVWYLSSSMSLGFLRIEPMRYTKYIQQCLAVLEQEREYDTDMRLVTLVRIQHLTERIAQLNAPDDPAEEVVGLPAAPLSAYVSAFHSELDRIRNGLHPELTNDTLDIFYQSRNALKKFFDDWLMVPIPEFYNQTTPVVAQLVYGMTMLGRWAKYTAPIPLTKATTPMPQDTSARDPHDEIYKADSAYSASVSPSVATPSVTTGRDSQETSPISLREGTDPKLPAAVAALRSQIQTQPGLSLDVTGILSAICARFEEANASFQMASTEPGSSDHNLWSMSAIKVKITRAKLERWAEIVAAGTEALRIHEEVRDTAMADSSTSETGAGGTGMAMGQDMQPDVFTMPDWNPEMPWASEMLQGVDPSIWFDGYLDWGAVVMNSLGNLEHQNQS
ncbi:uncharacterized protein BKA55DRAFT_588121 [Fusarium redolens]|uniref:Vacuolar sorting protein Vps3844 C-terminal domain-containing protein n=1 Tax=Fusarium redolens TaxID=48865 RepID=A0A9P9R8C9_FUSRE|nr:uncharacterized protein BKA55DRAFT_588121 [Fusarium redolens]KAH7269394.1 hypothetical protein BKA55DRAFT_588121 [Fusarium redolens]